MLCNEEDMARPTPHKRQTPHPRVQTQTRSTQRPRVHTITHSSTRHTTSRQRSSEQEVPRTWKQSVSACRLAPSVARRHAASKRRPVNATYTVRRPRSDQRVSRQRPRPVPRSSTATRRSYTRTYRSQIRRHPVQRPVRPNNTLFIVVAIFIVGIALIINIGAHSAQPEAQEQVQSDDQDEMTDMSGVKQGAGDNSFPITDDVSFAVDSRDVYSNPYDWRNLEWNKYNNLAYEKDGKTLSREGIDVSQHNGEIDWNAVKKEGIDFAMVRVGARAKDADVIIEDSVLEQNLEGAKRNNIAVGAYFYSQATNADEARNEAEFVLSKLSGEELDYPIVFDFEPEKGDRAYTLSTEQRTDIAKAFCSTIKGAGYNSAIYSSSSDLTCLYNLDELAPYGFWLAEYNYKPTADIAFAVWQYTNQGTLKGIDGAVDLNIDLTPALQAGKGDNS